MNKLGLSSEKLQEQTSPFIMAADQILSTQTTGLDTLRQDGQTVFYSMPQDAFANREEILDYLNTVPITYDSTGQVYRHNNGNVVSRRVSDILDRFYKIKFKFFKERPTSQKNTLSLHKGSAIHKYAELIMNELLDGNDSPSYSAITSKVLVAFDDIEAGAESVFRLDPQHFEIIANGVKNIFAAIQKNQDLINEQTGNVDGTVSIMTEHMIYDEKRDLAGTVDVLCVYSNGTIGIYDYKTHNFVTNEQGEVLSTISQSKRDMWGAQITQYKNIITDSIVRNSKAKGKVVKVRFAETRMLPVNIQFNPSLLRIKGMPYSPVGLASLEFQDYSKSYLMDVPVAEELSHVDSLNNSLIKLYSLLKAQKKKYSQEKTIANKNKLLQTQKLIDTYLVQKDYYYSIMEIKNIDTEFRKNVLIHRDSGVGLTAEKLNDYRTRVETLLDFMTAIDTTIPEDSPVRKDIHEAVGLGASLINSISESAVDLLREITGVDISVSGEKMGFVDNELTALFEQKGQSFRALNNLISGVINNTQADYKEFGEQLTKYHNELLE